MPTEVHEIPARIEKLVKITGSVPALAKLGEVSKQTVHNWLHGLGFHDTTMEDFAKAIGVEFLWLRDGIGTDAEQIVRFRERLSTCEPDSSRIKEDMYPPEATVRGPYAVLEKMVVKHQPDNIADTIAEVLRDESAPVMERLAAAERLSIALTKRISIERRRHQR